MSTLGEYLEIKMKADTAKEVNENSQAIYRRDLIYLFFKLLLFVVLVLFYMYYKPNVEKKIVPLI